MSRIDEINETATTTLMAALVRLHRDDMDGETLLLHQAHLTLMTFLFCREDEDHIVGPDGCECDTCRGLLWQKFLSELAMYESMLAHGLED